MAKSVKFSLDFKTAEEEDLYTLDIPLRFEVHTSGTIHGLAFWFDVAFIGSYSTVWVSIQLVNFKQFLNSGLFNY